MVLSSQGRALGRDGQLQLELHQDKILVGGTAVTCIDGYHLIKRDKKTENFTSVFLFRKILFFYERTFNYVVAHSPIRGDSTKPCWSSNAATSFKMQGYRKALHGQFTVKRGKPFFQIKRQFQLQLLHGLECGKVHEYSRVVTSLSLIPNSSKNSWFGNSFKIRS